MYRDIEIGMILGFEMVANDDLFLFKSVESNECLQKPTPNSDLYLEFANISDLDTCKKFAATYGPLFGMECFDEGDDLFTEQSKDWLFAVSSMNWVLRMKAYIDGRISVDDIEPICPAVGFSDGGATMAQVNMTFVFKNEKSAYAKMLRGSLFESRSPIGIGLVWQGIVEDSNSIQAFTRIDTPLLYVCNDCEGEPFNPFRSPLLGDFMRFQVDMMLQTCIAAHTKYVTMGFVGDDYLPRSENMLAFLWHQLAQDFASQVISVCKECHKIINCTGERRNKKEYCGKTCRDAARNRRNSIRRKIRKLAKDGCSPSDIADQLGVSLIEVEETISTQDRQPTPSAEGEPIAMQERIAD